jgi:putative glutamine amidotransferase
VSLRAVPPRILVTTSRGKAVREYLDAIREAGGEPQVVAPGDPVRALLGDAAGVLLTGGVDVDPASYHASASPFVTETEPERDLMEIDLLRAARARALPTLCICRGLQIANVAFGGTLLADVPHHFGSAATVRHDVLIADGRSERGLIAEHIVRIEPGSLLHRAAGTVELVTGARHHQAVDRPSGELRVVGRTPDGVVEALEAEFASPFWLAVQWHPESTRDLDGGTSRALFGAFVQAAIRRCVRPGAASGGARSAGPR